MWALPPPVALAAGEVEPVRVFDTAEAALAFLAAMAAVSNGSRLRPLVAACSAVCYRMPKKPPAEAGDKFRDRNDREPVPAQEAGYPLGGASGAPWTGASP